MRKFNVEKNNIKTAYEIVLRPLALSVILFNSFLNIFNTPLRVLLSQFHCNTITYPGKNNNYSIDVIRQCEITLHKKYN